MPRLNPTLGKAIFFLYALDTNSSVPGKLRGPEGTGTIIGRHAQSDPLGKGHLRHAYAVTNHHVVQGGATILRLNTKDGKSRTIHTEPHEWMFKAGGDDLAVIDISDRLDPNDDIVCFSYDFFAMPEFIGSVGLGPGDDGFMLGLFARLPGTERNAVAARFGNVSLLASTDAPAQQPNGAKRPSHIFDMRSRPGFSGSPVFVYRTPTGDLREAHLGARMPTPKMGVQDRDNRTGLLSAWDQREWEEYHRAKDNLFMKLLGIHAGQYPEMIEARKVAKPPSGEADEPLRHMDKLWVPSSMTVVVPAWEIANLLEHYTLMDQRIAREERDEEAMDQKPIPEASTDADEPEAPTSGESEGHEARLKRLVRAAATTKPKGDRT